MNQHGGPANECRCGRPTRDAAYVCDHCSDELAKALGDVPWLSEELQITASRQKGVDYRRGGGGKGGKKAAEMPLPVHWGASEARTHLKALLASWVRFCADEQVRSTDQKNNTPTDDMSAMSRWLLWRVDGLALHEIGPDAVDEIVTAVGNDGTNGKPTSGCYRAIDNAPDKWFAGPCNADTEGVECGADLYALSQKGEVTCHVCSTAYDVAERRTWLLNAAQDRLADATELARSVSWLGSRTLNRDRVYQWAKRGRITAKAHLEGKPLYRIGDAIDLLTKEAS